MLATIACHGEEVQSKPSIIYYTIEKAALTPDHRISSHIVQQIVDNLVMAVTGQPTVAAAWGSLVSKTDRVGIKVSAAGGSVSGTNPEVVDAIVSGLTSAGLSPSQIVVWDRNLEDLVAAGYRRDGTRYQLRWINPANGYDQHAQVTAPVLGKLIWGDSGFVSKGGLRFADLLEPNEKLSNKSYYAKILTTEVTKIINVPSLADSFLTGVNGALANLTLPNLDNWRRFTRPPLYGDPYLAEIYADPMIHDKVVLTILDGLFLQYAGGPFANPGFTVENFTLYASRDPIALDATAMQLIDEFREPSKLPSLKPMCRWLESAESIGLGKQKESDIELKYIGLEGMQ